MPVDQLIEGLRARGYAVESQPRQVGGQAFAVISPYPIEVGQHAGREISLAIPAPPDYPLTPPGGIHVSPHLIPVGTRNVHQSPLGNGSDWQYWSRPVVDWRQDRSLNRLLSHINRLMQDA